MWDLENAIKWVKGEKLKADNIDIKKNHIRFRQYDPVKGHKYRTKKIGETGVEFIIDYDENTGGNIENGKIILSEAIKISKKIKEEYKKSNINLIQVGSIKRKNKYVGDIDFITTDNLMGRKYINYELPEKIKVDIWKVKKENKKLGYDIRTYPRHYIIAIRIGLKKIGYRLTDQELLDNKGKKIKYENMKQLSKLAGVVYHRISYYNGK
jgi:DNA polymerase/3'-5' exonuclease PolX